MDSVLGMQRKLAWIVQFVFATMLLSACVTINIYFPAAAAEKAADKIIEEVWQLEDEKKEEKEE
ncbi:hypothetical protein [Nitrosomonas sp.]|uniref:hypothetical protein n=1 Tax=Nitrosomonas sp. TaxID=42353 RepID=UPI0028465794|nr:hypothetical protein [Nitrosomonas sp.]MDR4514381.1 hypothetical protein [Nitrosomonas sp.]